MRWRGLRGAGVATRLARAARRWRGRRGVRRPRRVSPEAGATSCSRCGPRPPGALAKLAAASPTSAAPGPRYLCFGFAATARPPAARAAGGVAVDADQGVGTPRAKRGSASAARRRGAARGSSPSTPPASRWRGARSRARLARPKPTKLVLSIVDGRRTAGLAPATTAGASSPRAAAARSATNAPRATRRTARGAFRLRPVRAVGCTGGDADLVTNGRTERKVVALTFDDGPSEYTDRYLDVLREKGVPGDLLRDRPGDAGTGSDDAADPRRRRRDRRPHREPRRIPRLRADRRRGGPDRGIHRLQALPLPAARRRGQLERRSRPRARSG